jgi:UDP-N-acetylglucosamine/UDP-N-acetylgalactosamine diphosphorylase
LNRLDFVKVFHNYETAKSQTASDSSTLQPIIETYRWGECKAVDGPRLQSLGYQAIREGKVAAIIMSGGQGTRLGYHGPKGMYSMGLLSGKTIFQLHIERLQRVRHLAREKEGPEENLQVFIMTSDVNDTIIRSFFAENGYFGYPSNQVYFFEQGLEPCLTLDGKLIIESEDSLAMAPDGNGGIYHALRESGSQ